jgi:hypothetical protein
LPDAFSNQFLVWLQRSAELSGPARGQPLPVAQHSGQEYLASIIAEPYRFQPSLPALDQTRLTALC